ncbi:vesicle transport protein, partial [Umbelopsis sp. PMI_123]
MLSSIRGSSIEFDMPVAVNSQIIKDERNLHRLIIKCKARLSQDNVDTWSGSDRSKFVQYVKYAQNMCEYLEKQKGSISPEMRVAIEELAKFIEQEDMNVTIDKGIVQAQAGKAAVLAVIDKSINHDDEKQLHVQKQVEDPNIEDKETAEYQDLDEKMSEKVKGSPHSNDEEVKAPPITGQTKLYNENELRHRKSQATSSNSTHDHEEETAQIEHVLQHHRQLQEELTGDLSRMAAQLKSNSLAFGDLLEKDDKVLRDAQDAVASNLDRLRKERTRLDLHNSKAWGTTFMTCGIMMFVTLMFVLVFFTIKFLPKAK